MSRSARVRALWERVGPRARDIVVVVIVLLSAVAVALGNRDQGPWVWSFMLLIGLAGAVAMWWRRRCPVAVTVVGLAVYALTLVPVALGFGLFSLAVRRRDRVLALMTVVAAAAFSIVAAFDTANGATEIVVLGLFQAGFCTAAGAYVGARADLVATLRERAVRAEEERELRADQAKVDERARIAREMHDVLAHKVSLIALHAGALEVNATATHEQIERAAGLIRTTAHEAMDDLRDVLGVLRSGAGPDESDLAPPPRAADIERVVEASRAAGVHAELTMDVAELPDAVARTAYRVVREGLTNVHKHARGAATVVRVAGDEGRGVTVEVVNQNPVGGAALLPGSGVGLLGLRERVTLLGGSLEAGPCTDGGWRLTAWLPWNSGHAATVSEGAA